MRLTHKSEYALLALIDLTELHVGVADAPGREKGFRRTVDIAEAKGIPKKYLEQILLTLKRSGYVKSRQGAEGGYMLAKAPDHIHLAEIIRLMDGPLAPANSVSSYFYQSTPLERNEKIIAILKDIRDYIAQKLENTTLLDLV